MNFEYIFVGFGVSKALQPTKTRTHPAGRAQNRKFWLVDSIRAYIRVDVSGYPGNNGYPGSEEFGCNQVPGYRINFHTFFIYFLRFLNFYYIFCRFWGFSAGRVRVALPAAPRTSKKNTSLGFWSTCPMGLINFV